jgi:hypothetical protein
VTEELNERGWHLTAAIVLAVPLIPQYERGRDGSGQQLLALSSGDRCTIMSSTVDG